MRATTILSHLIFIGFAFGIPVDNNVEGEPEIECGHQGMQISFKTRNPFNGRLYVRGRHDESDCLNSQIGRPVTGITLNFDTCGVQRLRSLNPRGIFASTTVVISFHPIFVTKVDRVYHVQCFYMEADKTVSQQIEVSDLTTAFITQLVPMPVCRYDILEGGPTGAPVHFAVVGQQVYHSWKCDSETQETFCMIVHSCFVDDGNGKIVNTLDKSGCALDRFVLNNLEYPSDLTAGQEAHVFKYADKSSLFFQCQISISVKEPNSECERPQCAELTRGKRHAINSMHKKLYKFDDRSTVDVVSQRIETMDAFNFNGNGSRRPMALQLNNHILTSDVYCVSAFASIAAFGILLGLSAGLVLILLSKRH